MAGFAINAVVLKQQGQKLFCFGMNSAEMKRISYVTPRSADDPEEVQRIVNVKRAKEIGEYIKKANSLLPNSIVVSFTSEVSVRDSGTAGVVVLEFPQNEGKYAYILDGQHRLEGFKHSDGIEYDLPVVAIHNADDSLRGKIFADINSKQKAVSDTHLLSLYYQIKEMSADETPVMDVIVALNEDANSPVHNRIKMLEKDKGWVKNTAFKKWLSPHLTAGGVLSSKNIAERTKIVKEYLEAIRLLWPYAWGENKGYVLTKAFGFEIMFGVFPAAKHRCDLNSGREYTAENFRLQMAPLTAANIELPGGATLRLDWGVKLGVFNNGRTRSLIAKQLRDILTRADED